VDAIPSLLTLVLALSATAQDSSAPKPPPPTPAQPQTPAQTPAKPPATPAQTPAQPAAQTPAPADAKAADAKAASAFTPEQLEQIVAPIALHPDSLLSQILMASTYPLEIVEAFRWQAKNASLKGAALEEALKKQDWDPAVKSICGLPTVLKQMNDSLDWTQDLGDAFLGQKEELMQTVQKMRKKALDAGTLKSGEQQKVSQDGDIVVIESTKTDVVYVPTYYPTAVYGTWSYPAYYYPPMYPPYPTGGVAFGFAVGIAWAGCWGGCNWHGNDVDINVNNFNNFNKNTSINPQKYNRDGAAGNKGSWNHNPEHRKGANYKDSKTAQKFGGSGSSNRVSKDQARGYDRAGSKGGASAGVSRPGGGTTPSAGGARPSAGTSNTGAGSRAGGGASTGAAGKAAPKSSGALSGSRSPGMDRSASTRGAASRGSSGSSARSSGGSRGGGRGGGGGRRR